MATLREAYSDGMSASAFAAEYMRYIAKLATSCDFDQIGRIAETLMEARDTGKTVFFVGNGGSASSASHFANDLSVGASRIANKPAFKAMSLTDNMAIISAVANDTSYDEVYASQLEPLIGRGDVLIALSVSGNSPNIVRAVEVASQKGAIVIGCTGFDGGALRNAADLSFHIPTEKGEYGPVEDMFSILDHCVTAYCLLSGKGDL